MLLAQREIILSILHTNPSTKPCGRDQSWGCSQPSPGTHSPRVVSGFVSAGTLYPQLFPQADSPWDVEKEQLQEATRTARINSAFHSSRHTPKVMLQGSHCCTAPVQDLQTK